MYIYIYIQYINKYSTYNKGPHKKFKNMVYTPSPRMNKIKVNFKQINKNKSKNEEINK